MARIDGDDQFISDNGLLLSGLGLAALSLSFPSGVAVRSSSASCPTLTPANVRGEAAQVPGSVHASSDQYSRREVDDEGFLATVSHLVGLAPQYHTLPDQRPRPRAVLLEDRRWGLGAAGEAGGATPAADKWELTVPARRTRPVAEGMVAAMAARGAAGAGGRRSMKAFLNDMLRRGGRVVPLGYSASGARGRRGAKLPPWTAGDDDDAAGPTTAAGLRQRRVLILMSDTGGGHRASAEAIKATFELEYGDEYNVEVVDLWKEMTPWPFNQMPKSYSFLVKHETLWKVAFHVTKPKFVHQAQMATTSAFVAREVARGISRHKPDVIVSVHPLMQHIPLRILRARGLLKKIPFTTVITDLTTCHPTWFHKLATVCFCPTKDVAKRALKAGLQPSQIRVYGLPIRPTFARPMPPRDELRRELEMDAELPAALLMGGGEGMGPVETTARAVAKALAGGRPGQPPLGQLVIICGRNKKLRAKLEAVAWPIPVQLKSFVTNISEYMAACDCIISKAGPGTIAESMIRGLPMIINDFIPGQEVGNVPFVVDNGAGRFSEKPLEIAQTVHDWFGPKRGELARMSANALKLARPDAVFKIVHDLDQLAKRRDTVERRQLALA